MRKQAFDSGWLFELGDNGGAARNVDDAAWRRLDLPHDWSIEHPRKAEYPTGASGGYCREGTGWYRKHFTVPPEWRGKRIAIEFEGVYREAEIWLNGRSVGLHPYGYTSFALDLTPYLESGEDNVLAVRVDNSTHGHTRWYSGSGIYRHVHLLISNPVHVSRQGLCCTTPEVSESRAVVEATAGIENHGESEISIVVRFRIFAPDGTVAAQVDTPCSVKAGNRDSVVERLVIERPLRWSVDSPSLYRIEADVLDDESVCLDGEQATFGIRCFSFSAGKGFELNGRPLPLRGGCVHHDCGLLGAASIDRAEERKVELLKANGFNAVRCAHNPPAPAFLDACDRLGMLVIDEPFDCWRAGKNPYDYHRHFDKWWREDLDGMVLRDRNHPSIVLWSIGNELVERGEPEGAALAGMIARRVRERDPTRPVTAGICVLWGPDKQPWSRTYPLLEELDVCGYNYRLEVYRSDHERFPERVILATESHPSFQFQYDYWKAVEDLPYVAGDFVWTALDYLGEAGIGGARIEGDTAPRGDRRHFTVANCGDLDLCGEKRPQSFYRDVLWKRAEKPFIAANLPVPEGCREEISPWGWEDEQASWNWPGHENKAMRIHVYFDCEEVELLLNEKSLGRAPAGEEEKHRASFDVPYAPGELKAVAFRAGKPVSEAAIRTTGAPCQLRLCPDRDVIRSDGRDLSYVSVRVCDREGRIVPDSEAQICFTVKGPGRIVATGNADPKNSEAFRGNSHRAWRGKAMAIVQSTGMPGDIEFHAATDNMSPVDVVIRAEA